MKRIYSLDLFKLCFAYIIALGHFGTQVSPGSSVTVQIFFIISGFFLARKFYTKSHPYQENSYNQWNYTLDHVKTLYPHYLFSLLILVCCHLLESLVTGDHSLSLYGAAQKLYELIPELLLVQNAGFFGGGINYPLWQMCVLVISGYFVYGVLCLNERNARYFVFPAAILMIQTLLAQGTDIWGSVGFFHVPLLRAFSPMCIGVLVYYLTTTPYYAAIKNRSNLFNILSVLALISIFVFKDHQNIFLITFCLVLLALYDEESWLNLVFNRKCFRRFGEFSYAIYLNHALIISLSRDVFFPIVNRVIGRELPGALETAAYLVILTVYSVVTLFIVNRIVRFAAAKRAAK